MLKNSILLGLVATILLMGTTYSAVLESNNADINSYTKLAFVNGQWVPVTQTQPVATKPETSPTKPQLRPFPSIEIQAPQTLIEIQNNKPIVGKPTLVVKPVIQTPNWSYLVGVLGSCAVKVISNQRPDLNPFIVKPGTILTKDLRSDRVLIIVDKYGVVTKTPNIG